MQSMLVSLKSGSLPKEVTSTQVISKNKKASPAKLKRAKVSLSNARNILDESVKRQRSKPSNKGGPSKKAVAKSTSIMGQGFPLSIDSVSKRKQNKAKVRRSSVTAP